MNTKETKETKEFKFPHTYVIIMCVVIIATILTWIIPAGAFDRVKDSVTHKSIIVKDSFKFIQSSPVNPLDIPLYIMKGMVSAADIIFLVLIVGGAFSIIIKTEVFQAIINKFINNLKNAQTSIIPIFTTIFALACTSIGVNTFIGFAPIAIILARSLGYDALVGVSMVMLGGAIGFSTGSFNPFTTGVAQAIGGLPLFSGAWYRLISLVVFLIVTNIYLINYAKKVQKDKSLSVLQNHEFDYEEDDSRTIAELNFKHYIVLLIVLACFAFIIYGGLEWHWKLKESGAVFIWMGILSGVAYGFTFSEVAKEFVVGAKKLVFGALIIGLAKSISLILAQGHILDTSVYYLSAVLSAIPSHLQAISMFLMQLVINGLITSGSGQAAVTMPIMFPISDIVGITRQTSILAFNFGDGLSNYVLPTSSALMGFLAISNIGYITWMRFIWKLFLIWIATGAVLVAVANMLNYS